MLDNELKLTVVGEILSSELPPANANGLGWLYQDDYSLKVDGHVKKVRIASQPTVTTEGFFQYYEFNVETRLHGVPGGAWGGIQTQGITAKGGWISSTGVAMFYRVEEQEGDKIKVNAGSPTWTVGTELILHEGLPSGVPSIVAHPHDSALADSFYTYMHAGAATENNRFAPAYIQPDTTTLNGFDDAEVDPTAHNKLRAGNAAEAYQAFDQRRGSNGLKSPVFWVAYFSTGYEWEWNFDADPNALLGGEQAHLGQTFGNLGEGTVIAGYEAYAISVGFVEVIRDSWFNEDAAKSRSRDLDDLRARVGVHEVAHQLLRLVPGPQGHRDDKLNIMHGNVDEVASDWSDSFYFAPQDLRTLRKTYK
jgi:hypothetical protein